jgi:hypothetical protein
MLPIVLRELWFQHRFWIPPAESAEIVEGAPAILRAGLYLHERP